MQLAVLDLETDPFLPGRKPEPFLSGYYDGKTYISIWDDSPAQVIVRTVAMLKQREPSLIYLHNGGRFDVFYFMKHLVPGSIKIINNRIVSCHMGHHELRDSYAIMPFPLRSYKKDDIDYDWFERENRDSHRDEIVSYLKGDCEYLHELCVTFHAEFGNKLTIGGSSIAQLKTFHAFERSGPRFDTRLRKDFYFGGRNQCFRTGLIVAPVTVYDVNAMYPYVMRDYLHPVGTEINISRAVQDDTAFLTVEGENRGAFPTRTKSGLDFTCPQGRFHVSVHEYRTAVETGAFTCRKIVECYNFTKRETFADYVNHFYFARKAAKASGDKARDLLYKFCLNSSYGKFAQNPENFWDYQLVKRTSPCPRDPCEHCAGLGFHNPNCHFCWRLNGGTDPVSLTKPDKWECKHCNGSGGKWFYSWGNEDYTIWAARPRQAYFLNVATGASITGAARAVLLRGIRAAVDPIYCDTDSIISRGHNGELNLSESELGAWKVEAVGDAIAVAGKKLYAVYSAAEPKEKSESVKIDGRKMWCIKKAHKGARLSGGDILRIAQGASVEYPNPAPSFKLDGSVQWVNRVIKATVKL
jgi:DNA polymerase elongation subunit (family B)